jgi:hypothetical protein
MQRLEHPTMSITIAPELESTVPARAEVEGISIEACVERLVRADQQAEDELEALALDGLNSGEPVQVGPDYWEEKHRRLEERLNKIGNR